MSTPDGTPDITEELVEGLAGELPDELTPEQEERARQMAKELSDSREQILQAEVSTVIANHALGIYELAALHLTQEKPRLLEARLAIDALAALVESEPLVGKLGDAEPTLQEALRNARLAFVQRAQQFKAEAAAEGDSDDSDS